MENVTKKRILIRRDYDNPTVRLRKIFDIPDDEMILSFEWDKSLSHLRLVTLKDLKEEE